MKCADYVLFVHLMPLDKGILALVLFPTAGDDWPMTDRPPTADQQDADRRGSRGLSVAAAADRLGLTPDAVRGRLHRGTLEGEKVGTEWRVFLPTVEATAGRQASQQPPTAEQQDTTADRQAAAVERQETDRAADSPLVELVADLARRNEDLAAAAAMWQTRAAYLEDRLLALTAGDGTRADAPQGSPFAPGEAQPATVAANTSTPAHAPWWRRWLGLAR